MGRDLVYQLKYPMLGPAVVMSTFLVKCVLFFTSGEMIARRLDEAMAKYIASNKQGM